MEYLRRITTVALALIVLMGFGIMTAAASQPDNFDVSKVTYLDNGVHTLAPYASQLFRFDYALKSDGTRPDVTMRLLNGTNSGVSFGIWTASQLHARATTAEEAMADIADNQPIGRGTAATFGCYLGSCQSSDLTWSGAFGSGGAYYVSVTNNNPAPRDFQLMIQGSGVSLAPKAQVVSAEPQRVPAAAPRIATTGSSPYDAAVMDGQQHIVGAGTSTWYRLDYALKSDGTRPVVTLRLVNGTKSGVSLALWTSDQLRAQANTAADAMADPANNQPIGQGTATDMNCYLGTCQSPDLVWSGAFGASGTYFIQVINRNAFDSSYRLTVSMQ